MRVNIVETWKQLLLSSRPISWVNTAYPFGAAYLLATAAVSPTLIIGTFYFLIPYNLMMYGINDVFDYESDIHNPRKGGIEGAQLTKSLHRLTIWVSVGFSVPFIAYLLLQGSIGSKLFLCYLVFMVLAYSVPKLRFKERPFLDSFTSSTHFVGPMIYAMLLTGWQSSYWPYVLAFFLWGMASHALGAVQDIIADRLGGIHSIATVMGSKATIAFASIAYAVAGALVLTSGAGLTSKVLGVLALLYLVNALRFIKLSDAESEQAHAGWQVFIWLNWFCGFIVTLLIVFHFKHIG